jgi:two-component system, NarL family, sensor histidine kinase DesK
MSEDVGLSGLTSADWLAGQRKWADGWRLMALFALPLLYLAYVGASVAENSRGSGEITGFVVLAVFAACWLALPLIPGVLESSPGPRFWVAYAVLVALFLAELPFGRAAAFVLCLYIALLSVGQLGAASIPIVAALSLAALVVPVAVTSWHVSLVDSVKDVTPLAIPVTSLVSFAVRRVIESNQALAEAYAEIARLAAENERFRIGRDLHDLLGHSLTTITVKAGLARRIGATDLDRCLQEIAAVEELSRRSLSDVRAAVSGYHEVTLAGEIATGHELLRAAGIAAELPAAVDVVEPSRHELFGWVVREGVTNVVRHAHASSCAIRLSASSVEIVDDGVGAPARAGNGLTGLTERVAEVGGVVEAGPVQPRGWRLRVSLASAGDAR